MIFARKLVHEGRLLMKKITEIRWHGRAGQGAKTAALLLAGAALKEGKYIQGFPEYGPEREGAPMKAFTRISESPILIHCDVVNPEAVVVLDSTLLEVANVTQGLGDEGILLVNTKSSPEEIRERLKFNKGKVFTVDATPISLKTLGRNLPNMPMLGALIKVNPLIKLETLLSSVREKFEKKFNSKIAESNISAIEKAYEEVKLE